MPHNEMKLVEKTLCKKCCFSTSENNWSTNLNQPKNTMWRRPQDAETISPKWLCSSSKAVQNILRAVIKEVNKGDFKPPVKLDLQLFVFDRDLEDTSSVHCAATLIKCLLPKTQTPLGLFKSS